MKELPLFDLGGGTVPEAGDASGQVVRVREDYRPRRARDVLALDMGDGFILYDHEGSLVHHLNPAAGIVWQLSDGTAPVAELASDIAREFSVSQDQIERQLSTLIAELDALGLVENAGATGPEER